MINAITMATIPAKPTPMIRCGSVIGPRRTQRLTCRARRSAEKQSYPLPSEAGCSLLSINENGATGERGVLPSANHSMCAPPATNRNFSAN